MSADIASSAERGRIHAAIDLLAAEIAALASSDLIGSPRSLARIEKLTKIIKVLRAEAVVMLHHLSDEEAGLARGQHVPGRNYVCGAGDVGMELAQDFECGEEPVHYRHMNPAQFWPGRADTGRDAGLAVIDATEARRRRDEQGVRKAELEELALIDHILSNDGSAVAKRSRDTLERRADALTSSIGASDGPGDPNVVRADVVRGHPPEGEGQESDRGGDLQAHPC